MAWQEKLLDRFDLSDDPFVQFNLWYQEADTLRSDDFDPDAVCLSTIDPNGYPDSRMVLLKGCGPGGFVFYTNTDSTKGQSLKLIPRAAMCFYWSPLRRQIRLSGTVIPGSEKEADDYFETRERRTQIGAWASQQSQPLADRERLESRYQQFAEKYHGQVIPRPSYWLGYKMIPSRIEFWQQRSHRLHDRFLYEKKAGTWEITRLYP